MFSHCWGQDGPARLVLFTFDHGLLAAKGRKAVSAPARVRPGGGAEQGEYQAGSQELIPGQDSPTTE